MRGTVDNSGSGREKGALEVGASRGVFATRKVEGTSDWSPGRDGCVHLRPYVASTTRKVPGVNHLGHNLSLL